ncbi:MAG: hypothetical protein AABY78_01315 [Nitrospirota bacterium]|jgi:hypothetical protein
MLKRRDFLRGFIGAGVSMGINPGSFLAFREGENRMEVGEFKEKAWMKTIFCMFENKDLETRIGELATRLNCEVCWGEPSSPDIIALPFFISVIDRNLVGENYWYEYIRFCRETDDDTPCLIVDNNKDLPVPKIINKKVSHFDLKDRTAIEEIIEIIMHKRLKVLSDAKNQS